jgi:hypothetical protein
MMDNSVMDNTASDTNQAPVEQVSQSNERLFKQSELNEIVGRAKHDAVESFKRQSTQQQASQQQAAPEPMHSHKSLSEDDVKRLTTEELNRQREDWERQNLERQQADAAKRIVSSYQDKISAGKDKYEDFEAVTNNVDMRYYPNVVQLLADHVDNAADVFYDLARNRTKLHQIESVCQHNPQDAIYEIQRLSNSIKANEDTTRLKTSKSPLSQQRPSNTGTDSGGALSVRDYKRMYQV